MKIITLKNGFRVALRKVDYVRSCAMYLYIGSGNCYENDETAGAAHFIEHLLFKGTSEFSDEELARKIDWLGGRFNAYTAKEYTCLYAHVLDEAVGEGLELLLKMATDSVLGKTQIETERGVILEEINMYEDSPEDCSTDALISHVFADTPLKYNILGTRETVSSFSSEALYKIMKKYYAPERMVLSVCGNFEESEVLELCEKYIGALKFTDFHISSPVCSPKSGIVLREKDFEQSQILISAPGATYLGENRYAASVYSAIAGGSSSSRLNLKIRERLGLAYSVGTFQLPFKNTGLFLLGAGVAHKNQLSVLEKAMEEMDKIPNTVTEEELASVKQQFKVSCVMSNERITGLAAGAGRDILYTGACVSTDEMLERINALTIEDIRNIAKEVWQKDRLALAVVGKPEKLFEYEKLDFKA